MVTSNAGWVLALVLIAGGTPEEADQVFSHLTYADVKRNPSGLHTQVMKALEEIRNG